MLTRTTRLAVLVSGSGTTLQNLLDACTDGSLDAEVRVVVASRGELPSQARADKVEVDYHVVDRKAHDSIESFSNAVFKLCDEARVDLVCCAGWLNLLKLPAKYRNRVLNVHPSLLPSFGGKGMYGEHVHQAVLTHGCKVTGCTVHLVDDDYDNGPIVIQRAIPVLDIDTPETLAKRVQEQERLAYPEAIRLMIAKRVRVEGRRTFIGD